MKENLKKILKYILKFTLIGIFITVIGLGVVDRYFYLLNNSTSTNSNSQSIQSVSNDESIKLDSDITDVQYAYNNKYYLYLKDGKIYINDMEKKESVDVIEEKNPICFYNILYDKNLIIYFTQKKVGTSSKLTIKTYEIASKSKMEYNDFTVNNFSKIKELECSPVINVKYINVETKVGATTNNIIYRVDLFNSMSTVTSGKIISKLTMLKQKDKLYYEDTKGNIYYAGGNLGIFKEKVNMIGTDIEDNLYFISSEKKDVVYKVQNNKIVDTIKLSDTDVVSTYSNNTNVYLIYSTYIVNISSDEPTKKLTKLSNYVDFEAIKDNTAYLRLNDNIIIKKELLK